MKIGVYSDKDIRKLVEDRFITSSGTIKEEQIQPSSFDLTVSNTLYHLPFSSLPIGNIDDFLKTKSNYTINLEKNSFLHKGNVYVAELNERLNLPAGIIAKANPKSSIGRVDVHVRLITENGKYFDEVPQNYSGKLYLEIFPNSFDISFDKDISLNQLRFFDVGTQKLDGRLLKYLSNYHSLLLDNFGNPINPDNFIDDDSVYFTLDLTLENPGYVARHDAPPVNLSKRDLPLSKYFNKVNVINDGIIIQKDSFYLFRSLEKFNIPKDHCAEMVDVSTKSGEFRAHYAGFFDPGFNSNVVLEVRNSGAPLFLRNKQRIVGVNYFQLKSEPEKTYGQQINSSYQNQEGVKPAKFFDENK